MLRRSDGGYGTVNLEGFDQWCRYELAAEQGDSNALGHIGNMYVQGIHVEPNNETALKYFR